MRFLQGGRPSLRGVDAGYSPDSPTRARIDLAGEWEYSLDEDSWQPVQLPASMDYEGKVVFRRKLAIGDSLLASSGFKFVAFGINEECEVSINDRFVGRHVGGYTSFEFDIPEGALQSGPENVIKVVVWNSLAGRTTLPIRLQVWGWRNYGGILRDIFIVSTPRTWIDRLKARTVVAGANGEWSVDVDCQVARHVPKHPGIGKSDSAVVALSVELLDRSTGAVVVQKSSDPFKVENDKTVPSRQTVAIPSPRLWSAEKPDLYLLRVSLIRAEGTKRVLLDQTTRNIGLVTARVEGNALLINGVRTTLKGVVWMEDDPGDGASLSYERMEKDVVAMKSLGVNAVRFAFHPPHPYMLNLCSRYGLYVMEEIPVWGVPSEVLADDSFRALAEGTLRELIDRDGNKPCVIAWGVGSEFDASNHQAEEFVRAMRDVVRSTDDRPVYYGTSIFNDDACIGAADITGLVMPPDDRKPFRRTLAEWSRKHPDRPLWVLSYGREVQHGNRNGTSDPMSQESQARYFLQHYGSIKDVKASASFIMAFADWRGSRPILTIDQNDRTLTPVGLVNVRREKRLSYDMVRALYNDENISALPMGTHKTTFPIAHVLTGLFILLVVGHQYHYNRRFGEALKRAIGRSYNFFADLRDVRAVSALHTLLIASMISLTLAVLTSGILYHYRTDRVFDAVLGFFILWDPAKSQLAWATWHPFTGILVLAVLYFLLSLLLAFALRVVGFLIRSRAGFFHVFSVAVWGGSPIVFLSPLAMSLFKIMENSLYVIPVLAVIVLFFLWTFVRVLKGVSVVFDVKPVRTYVGGTLVLLLLCGGVAVYYESTYALRSFLSLVFHLVQNLG